MIDATLEFLYDTPDVQPITIWVAFNQHLTCSKVVRLYNVVVALIGPLKLLRAFSYLQG